MTAVLSRASLLDGLQAHFPLCLCSVRGMVWGLGGCCSIVSSLFT